MSDFSRLELSVTFIISGLEPRPSHERRRREECTHVHSYLRYYLCRRLFAHAGYRLQVLQMLGEMFPAHVPHAEQALRLLDAEQVNLLQKHGYHVGIHFRYHTCQRSADDVVAVLVPRPAVDASEKDIRVCHPAGQIPSHLTVALRVYIGHIVAQADVASLECRVQLALQHDQPATDVGHSAVILPQLLYQGVWNVASADKAFLQARRYPLGVLHVTLATRQLLYRIGVHQDKAEVGLQRAI